MLGAALALAIQAAPPPATGQSTPTVVVTGRRTDRAKAVRHMTATIAPVGDGGHPLPRFAEPICPRIDGLPPELAARFAERMNDRARAAGLRVAGAGCSPNISVVFVPNGQAVVRGLRQRGARVFGTLEPHDIARLAGDPGPVHIWSFTEMRSRDDDRLRIGTTVTSSGAPELQVREASIIQSATKIVVDGAAMLIDEQASVGKTINQLADYATMRILAQARPIGAGAAAEPTILGLFDAEAPPPAMTPFDVAYLKSLYHGQPTEMPHAKVAQMARAINKALSETVAATEAIKPER